MNQQHQRFAQLCDAIIDTTLQMKRGHLNEVASFHLQTHWLSKGINL